MEKKGVSYVEVIVAFSIFLFGISILLFIFYPYFRPTYLTALDMIEKNFDKNFAKNIQIVKVIINKTDQTDCVKFKIYKNFDKSNILIFNLNWEKIDFNVADNNVVLSSNEKEFFLLVSDDVINLDENPPCNAPTEANVYYSPPISEKFILNINNEFTYEQLKDILLPGLNNDFNITIYDTGGNLIMSFGKPLPRTNIFAKQRIYKRLENNKINIVKVVFYIW